MVFSKRKFPTLISPLSSYEAYSQDGDLTSAHNWFVPLDETKLTENNPTVSTYTISIPALKIDQATTIIGSDDLSRSLIHFTGTALPGKIGNPVIFGHSVLPIFFNPKNYMTIFSTLHKLELGDDILVEYDKVTYTYSVQRFFEVYPNDIQVLYQDTNGAYLTLVTCSPPGHPGKPKRLIVRAKLKNI